MRNRILFLFCWLGHLSVGFAQRGLPPLYVVPDSAYFSPDTTHFQILEDREGNLNFNQVQRSTSFHVATRYDPKRQSHVYWMRMRLKNNQTRPLSLYLYEASDAYNYLDVYWLDSSRHWQQQHTGTLVPKSKQPLYGKDREKSRVLLQLVPGQESTVYQRLETAPWESPIYTLSPAFQTRLSRLEAVYTYMHTGGGWESYWFEGITIGILLLAVGYNLLTFFSTRERVYLYFAVCLFFFVLDRNYYRIQLALFSEYPYVFILLRTSFFLIFFIFFIQSIRQFIQSDQKVSGLNKSVSVMLVVICVTYVAVYLFQYSTSLSQQASTLNMLLEVLIRVVYAQCIVLIYRAMKGGVAEARFILVAIIPLFCLWLFSLTTGLVWTFAKINLAPGYYNLSTYAESICFAWMIIFFSGALINRYNLSRRQVAQQAIEREQVEREREIERSRIIASQNERLEQQVQERTAQLQQSLETLKATQNQLVQKEKLASLGELTAGIAHEIQNPLNFVNNFSEVSIELLDELNEERGKAKPDTELEAELLTDLQQNLRKINQHGQRAGSIVRGMLEHSRSSTGEKQPADLNAIVDESLRLAYHGLRAKDKSFNCQLNTNFDPSLPNVTIVSQDLSRVLINLYNNAFYAVREKARMSTGGSGETTYQPAVTVQTLLRDGNKAIVRIHDNGTGIPTAVTQKIFQPFFTTKPTGEGTGLGLSLSYDIITKGHNGDMTVTSQDGEGTEFIITLPIT